MSGSVTLPPCYCITGHGRSGTSFIAAMLQSAGLDIGQRLMGAGASNPRGHFEDMEFHEFHVTVLRSRGFGEEGFIDARVLEVPQQMVTLARAIIERRRHAGRPWGWKEPRSTLLLDFWRELVPELRFLLLFRRPWDVIDSLFRRGDPLFRRNPNLAVQVWLNYNQALIDFHDRFPEHSLLIESQAAADAPQRLSEIIADRFGNYLGPVGKIYDDQLFHHDSSPQQRAVLTHFFPETMAIYEQLRARASLVLDAEDHGSTPDNRDWALQHWFDLRRLEAGEKPAVHALQAQLDEAGQRLQQAQVALEHQIENASAVQLDLERVQGEREALRIQFEHTEAQRLTAQAEAEQTRSDLLTVEGDRETVRQRLAESEAGCATLRQRLAENEAERVRLSQALERSRTHLEWVETSRFWKLRRLWHRIRSPFRPSSRTMGNPESGPLVNGRKSNDHQAADIETPSHPGAGERASAVRHSPTRPVRP